MPLEDATRAAKGRKVLRKSKGAEPVNLPLQGILGGWDPKWKVGFIVGSDGAERAVSVGAFGPDGLQKAKTGCKVAYALRPDGAVLAAKPI